MGNFRVVLNAIGGHGCQRDKKDGEQVFGCRSQTCPDCVTQEYVAKMQEIGCNILDASLTHWPETPTEVKEEFVLRKYEPVTWKNSDGTTGTNVSTTPVHRIRHGNF